MYIPLGLAYSSSCMASQQLSSGILSHILLLLADNLEQYFLHHKDDNCRGVNTEEYKIQQD